MKIAKFYSFEDVRVEDVDIPEIGPGEALARVKVCGVCTGEAMPWYVNGKCPTVLGHEPIGIIEKTSPDVTCVTTGDRVFFHHHTSCGTCKDCSRGHPTLCREFKETHLDPGGFSEYVRIPRLNLEKDTLIIPPGVTDEEGIMIEPLACTVHSMKRLNIKPGDTVLVIGLGIMGLLNIQASRIWGASKVIGCDLIESRNVFAQSHGADTAIQPSIDALHGLTDGRGAECVIVGPPSIDALKFGLESAAPGATVQLFAPMPPDKFHSMDYKDFYFKEITLNASYSCDASDTREALKLLEHKKINMMDLITHRLDLSGVGQVLKDIYEGRDVLKAAVYPAGVS